MSEILLELAEKCEEASAPVIPEKESVVLCPESFSTNLLVISMATCINEKNHTKIFLI